MGQDFQRSQTPCTVALSSLYHKNWERDGRPVETGSCVFECRAENSQESDENQGSSGNELEMLDFGLFDDDALLIVRRSTEPELNETAPDELPIFVNYVWGVWLGASLASGGRKQSESPNWDSRARGAGLIVISGISER